MFIIGDIHGCAKELSALLDKVKADPEKDRLIRLMLKDSDGKLLLSVKNPFRSDDHLDYVNQIPAREKDGHGYGTQSILYMTEKLGGKCQFSVQNDLFILRVVL